MGIWEAVIDAINGKPGVTAQITQISGDGISQLTILDTQTGYSYVYTLDPARMSDFHAAEIVNLAMDKLRGKELETNMQRLLQAQAIMGIELTKWQREYILCDTPMYLGGRRNGRTTAHKLKTLLDTMKPLRISPSNAWMIVDEPHGDGYAQRYIKDLIRLRNKLVEGGMKIRRIELDDYRGLSGHYGRRRQLDGERMVMGFRTAEQQMIDKEVSHDRETAGKVQDEGHPDQEDVQEPEELLQDRQGD